jgi:hypothetical protein
MKFGKHKKVKKKEVAENSVALNEEDRVRAAMEAQYKRKPKPFYFRKNLRLATAGVQSIFLLPRRLRRGPIYPSYSKRLGACPPFVRSLARLPRLCGVWLTCASQRQQRCTTGP